MTLQQSLEALAERNGGELTAAAVVDYARPKTSPIHDRFTWDNKVAGDKYRLLEAAMLIRSVRISFEDNAGAVAPPVRAFVNIRENPKEAGSYIPIQRALSCAETSAAMLESAKREADSFRRKYASLEQARRVVEAIGEFVA